MVIDNNKLIKKKASSNTPSMEGSRHSSISARSSDPSSGIYISKEISNEKKVFSFYLYLNVAAKIDFFLSPN